MEMSFKTLVLLTFVLLNLVGLALMGIDKLKAKRGSFRIRERTLLAWAFFFGALGVYGGLKVFRHKTRHRSFTWVLPGLIIGQSLLLYWLLTKI